MTLVWVYVDEIIVTWDSEEEIHSLKYLDKAFSMKHPCFLHYFVGIEVIETQNYIILTQTKFSK